MDEIRELLERLKAATGPDKILDRDVLCAIDGWSYEKRGRDRQPWMYGAKGERRDPPGVGVFGAPRPTASIDAALALTERLLPGWVFDHVGQDAAGSRGQMHHMGWTAEISDGAGEPCAFQGMAPTLPLAILSALLSALLQEPNDEQS